MNILIPLSLSLNSAFLGDRKTRNNTRRFSVDKQGGKTYFTPSIKQWRWAFQAALDSLNLGREVDVDYVRFPFRLDNMPTVNLYERVWSPKDPEKRETFECFSKGSVLSFTLFLLAEKEFSWENNVVLRGRSPSREEVVQCFEVIGRSIGLSPWGSSHGYGRFEVLDRF